MFPEEWRGEKKAYDMMKSFHYPPPLSYIITLLFLCYFSVISVSPFISASIFRDGSSNGRNLLQALTSCPINFENQNYSIITDECRGPQYLASACCPALKRFACPYSDQLNDLTNNCASTMFSYITLSAKYPAGLFANECQDGKEGLDCSGYLPGQQYYNSNASLKTCKPSAMLILAVGAFLGLLFSFFM